LLDIQRDFQSFLVKSSARACNRRAAKRRGVFKPVADFSQLNPGELAAGLD